jgi:hypothetical protein
LTLLKGDIGRAALREFVFTSSRKALNCAHAADKMFRPVAHRGSWSRDVIDHVQFHSIRMWFHLPRKSRENYSFYPALAAAWRQTSITHQPFDERISV